LKSKSLKIGTIPTYLNRMTEKSGKEVACLKTQTSETIQVKRGRGRPKGAKNKPKDSLALLTPQEPKKRGRPKGAKNKPKVGEVELSKFKPRQEEVTAVPKKRGRPKKVTTDSVEPSVTEAKDSLDDHPLLLAAKWLEKHMHPSELQYYRTRANRTSSTLSCTIVGDLLGFFNVQNADICKQIKKNNFIDKVCNS